jgi:hypothetical protein
VLKLCTGAAAVAFGMLGVGAETRDKRGRLNRKGWISLIGIIVVGILAIMTAVHDYQTEKAKEKAAQMAEEDRQKQAAQLSIGIQAADVGQNQIKFPLKGITLSVVLNFRKTSTDRKQLHQNAGCGDRKRSGLQEE